MPPAVTRHSAASLVLVLALMCAESRTVASNVLGATTSLNASYDAASKNMTLSCHLQPIKACFSATISLHKTSVPASSTEAATVMLMQDRELTDTGKKHFDGRNYFIDASDVEPNDPGCYQSLTFSANEKDSGNYYCKASYMLKNTRNDVPQSEVTAVRTVTTPFVKLLEIQQTYLLNENETSKTIQCQVKTTNTEKVQVLFMLDDTDMSSSFEQTNANQEGNQDTNNPIASLVAYTRLYVGTINVSQELRDKRLKCSAKLLLDPPKANFLEVLVGSNKDTEEDAVLFVATPGQGQHEQPGFVDCTNHTVEARLGDVIVMSCAIAKVSTERASFWWTVINGELTQTCNSTDTCTQLSKALSFVEERSGLQVRLSMKVTLDSSNSKWRYKVNGAFPNRELSTDEFKVSVISAPSQGASMESRGSLLACSQLLLCLCLCHKLLLTLAGIARLH